MVRYFCLIILFLTTNNSIAAQKKIVLIKGNIDSAEFFKESESPGYNVPSDYGSSIFDDEQLTKEYFEPGLNGKPPAYIEIREMKRNAFIKKIIIWSVSIIILIALLIFFIKSIQKNNTINTASKNLKKEPAKQTIPEDSKIGIKDISIELEKINDLKIKGIITEEEFIKLKNRIIK